MKISVVNVESYGNMTSRIFKLQPGLNVFYGPNEAGKSTLRSFITTTMFPKSGLKYPTQKGTDKGSLRITLENGNTLTYEKTGKRSSCPGSELCGIDDKEYVTIYSMSPEDLRDVKGLEKGDIRNRFLTIPGGTDLPAAYESLDKERLALLPDSRRSSTCEIAKLMDFEHEMKMKVKELKNRESGDSNFAELVRQRNELEAQIEATMKQYTDADRNRVSAHRASEQADIVQQIEDLRTKERSLAYAENIDDTKLPLLRKECEDSERELRPAKERVEMCVIELNGIDPEVFLRNRVRIKRLEQMEDDYDYAFQERIRNSTRTVVREEPSRNLPVITIAGAAVTVAGIAAAAFVNVIAGSVVAVAGAIIAFIGLRSRRSKPTLTRETGEVKQELEPLPAETLLDEVAADTGIGRKSFHGDVKALREGYRKASEWSDAVKNYEAAVERHAASVNKMELYLSGYGGIEGYNKALEDSRELVRTRSAITALENSLKGIPEETVDTESADEEFQAVQDSLNDLRQRLGRVEQAISNNRTDMTTEEAITKWTEAGDAVYDASRKWARLMLEKIILDNASTSAYGNHQPDVLARADTYLSEMTGNRYRVNTDPRVTEISVIDNETEAVKSIKECSSGLEDQIKLSIKMAVSLSLSHEKPPVILDDILLTSDSRRKEGACRALAKLSEDIQVLYFTCDRETRDLLQSAGASVHLV